MNIHRWRKLEVREEESVRGLHSESEGCVCFLQSQGSDPSTYEMVQKIHTLQRKLIQKTEEVIIQYKHK